MFHILIVEDDENLNQGIALALKDESHTFTCCAGLKEALAAAAENRFDLVILDINLPDGSGLDFLKSYRRRTKAPVIVLTANNLETDIVTGLELGANDYITKPFSLMVLKARADVQLRDQKEPAKSPELYRCRGYEFDFQQMLFSVNSAKIELSKTEQRLLRLLTAAPGITLSREQLLDRVWNGESEFVDGHALTVTVKRLRTKLGEDAIKTVYGIGYRWAVK